MENVNSNIHNTSSNIAFLEVTEEFEKNLILKSFPNAQIYSQTLQQLLKEQGASSLEHINVLSTFIYSKNTSENLSHLPNLRLLVTRSTGTNHIDKEFCAQKSIEVRNVSKYGESTVAEFTFALLLTISRKIIPSVQRVKTGEFDFSNLQGFDLQGKTIGLIGFGNIGQKFAKMCSGFEMNVIAYDAFPENVKEIASLLDVSLVDLDTLFSQSDIISLHVPLFPQTHHIISKDSISKMKDGVILLNTSRGELLDTHAVLEGLNSEKIANLGLDVIEGECMMKEDGYSMNDNQTPEDLKMLLQDHILIKHPKVIVTPHNAFNTRDAIGRIFMTTFEEINQFLN